MQNEPPFRFELLGGVRIAFKDRAVPRPRTHRACAVLAYLLSRPDRALSRDAIIETFWPDGDVDSGRASLRTVLTEIRKALAECGEDRDRLIVADRATVRADGSLFVTDARELEDAVKRSATERDTSVRIQLLERAAEVYRGELLPGSYEDWVVSERDRLEMLWLDAMRNLSDLLREAGRTEEAIRHVTRILEVDREDEATHRRLMCLLAEAGRRDQSLRHFEALKRVLREEQGAAPSPETLALVEQIKALPPKAVGPLFVRREPASPQPISSEMTQPATPPVGVVLSPTPFTPWRRFRIWGRAASLMAMALLLGGVVWYSLSDPRLRQSLPISSPGPLPLLPAQATRAPESARKSPDKPWGSLTKRPKRSVSQSSIRVKVPLALPDRPAAPEFARQSAPSATNQSPERPCYAIFEIPPIGGDETEAFGINERGTVVGFTRDAGGKRRAILYADGNTQLRAGDTGPETIACDINSDENVVGQAPRSSESEQCAAWWDGPKPIFAPLRPDERGVILGVHERAVFVGRAATAGGRYSPFAWKDGRLIRLADAGSAQAVNDSAQVAGWVNSSGAGPCAVRWTISPDGRADPVEMPAPGGRPSMAFGINDRGDIAGQCWNCRTVPVPSVYRQGNWQMLELPKGCVSGSALDTNNGRQCVGYGVTSDGRQRALLWQPDGHAFELDRLLPEGTGWQIDEARAINSFGWIAGRGSLHGHIRGFLMAPITPREFTVSPATISSANVNYRPRRAVGAIVLAKPVDRDTVFTVASTQAGLVNAIKEHQRVTIHKGERAAFFFVARNEIDHEETVELSADAEGRHFTTVVTVTE